MSGNVGGNNVEVAGGLVSASAPSYPDKAGRPLSLDADGNLRVTPGSAANFVVTTATNGGLAVTDVAATALHLNGTGNSYVVSNAGSKTAFIAIGAAAVTVAAIVLGAVGGGYPILAGAIMTVSTSAGTDSYITAICLSGETTTLYISQGSGS